MDRTGTVLWGCTPKEESGRVEFFFIENTYNPVHHKVSHGGLLRSSLAHGFTSQDQTLLARFRSGHIKTMKFSEGCKSFEMCTNCSSEPATPAHVLECLGLTKKDLVDDPLLVLDFLKVYDIMV
ncbi:uncharacterized protein TNCV_4941082 [Trichonephila clavipes]|nr:uncharacterized protein TNCV_4941082 [Trichonephila clavipes]